MTMTIENPMTTTDQNDEAMGPPYQLVQALRFRLSINDAGHYYFSHVRVDDPILAQGPGRVLVKLLEQRTLKQVLHDFTRHSGKNIDLDGADLYEVHHYLMDIQRLVGLAESPA